MNEIGLELCFFSKAEMIDIWDNTSTSMQYQLTDQQEDFKQ
jgi:hypothetical protein